MADKRIEPCGVRCPPARDPLGLSKVVSGAGVKAPSGAIVQPSHDIITGQRNIDAFWEALPWSDGQTYFSRSAYALAVAPPSVIQLDAFQVPRGTVLAITGIVFRMKILLFAGPQYALVRDDFLLSDDTLGDEAMGMFYPMINNSAIVARSTVNNTTGFERAGFYLLNTSIQTPELPFVAFAKEGTTVQTNFESFAALFAVVNGALVGVEYEGLMFQRKTYDALRAKFNANR